MSHISNILLTGILLSIKRHLQICGNFLSALVENNLIQRRQLQCEFDCICKYVFHHGTGTNPGSPIGNAHVANHI